LTEIANHFGLKHYGGVGSAIHQVKKEMLNSRKIVRRINNIVKKFDP